VTRTSTGEMQLRAPSDSKQPKYEQHGIPGGLSGDRWRRCPMTARFYVAGTCPMAVCPAHCLGDVAAQTVQTRNPIPGTTAPWQSWAPGMPIQSCPAPWPMDAVSLQLQMPNGVWLGSACVRSSCSTMIGCFTYKSRAVSSGPTAPTMWISQSVNQAVSDLAPTRTRGSGSGQQRRGAVFRAPTQPSTRRP
jgi:hypothetical protein